MSRRWPARAAWLALGGLAMLVAAGAGLAVLSSRGGESGASVASERPTLLLLTSLPLVFGEQFGLDNVGSDALAALERSYRVVPIDVADQTSLATGDLLLMAHPRAQPAEALVELDAWVRAGGRLLLLADPALDWPSERPIGDRLRPPPAFADTGLLAHWGLHLTAPDDRGPKLRRLGGQEIITGSPGALSGRCALGPDRFVARCAIGHGRAVVAADADFLNVDYFDGPIEHNLPALLAELATLDSRRGPQKRS